MNIKTETIDQIIIVSVEGMMAAESLIELRNCLLENIEDETLKGMVLDLEKVDVIDSSGIGLIVSIFKSLKEHDRGFCLTSLSPKNRELFALTKLDQILTIVDDNDEGLRCLQIKP